MAISSVAWGGPSVNNTQSYGYGAVFPSGIQIGDIAIFILADGTPDGSASVSTNPTGFNYYTSISSGTYAGNLSIFYKVCNGTESGTGVSGSLIGYQYSQSLITVYRGVDTVSPILGFNYYNNNTLSFSNALGFSAITTNIAGAYGLHIGSVYATGSVPTLSAYSSGWTGQYGQSYNPYQTLFLEDKANISAITEPGSTLTLNADNIQTIELVFALNAAASSTNTLFFGSGF